MSNYKILFGITGSIAAYKSAYLISKLVQNGFEVKVVATENAFKFIGDATLEGLTGNKVYCDSFEQGEMMNHINLMKWADLIIVCPASANTINKFTSGIADNLITSLFLAYDFKKPFLIAPAMNVKMYEHPVTKESLKKLSNWGIKVLQTSKGYLACGDIGEGKLLEPDEIYEHILVSLNENNLKRKLKILVTAGGTKENIDGIRYITNLSTGRTASEIANYFARKGHNVTYLHAFDATTPSAPCNKISYNDFNDLNKKVESILNSDSYDLVIHNAAVSDYSPVYVELGSINYDVPLNSKIKSDVGEINIHLMKNPKILDKIKDYSKNKNLFLVAFKFTNTLNEEEKISAVRKSFQNSNCDIVVNNDLNDRDENNVQRIFHIYDKKFKKITVNTANNLSEEIEKIIIQKIGDKI